MNAIFLTEIYLTEITIFYFINKETTEKQFFFESFIRHFVTSSKDQFQFYFDIETT